MQPVQEPYVLSVYPENLLQATFGFFIDKIINVPLQFFNIDSK